MESPFCICRPPSPEELELARMIIFAVFLRASEAGCFGAAEGTCSRRMVGLLKKTRTEEKEKKRRRYRQSWGGLFLRGQRTFVWGYSDEREGGCTAEYSGKGLC